jgi:hypothetical protein
MKRQPKPHTLSLPIDPPPTGKARKARRRRFFPEPETPPTEYVPTFEQLNRLKPTT